MSKTLRYITVGLLSIITIGGYGAAMALSNYTLVAKEAIWSGAALAAMLITTLFGHKIQPLTGIGNRLFNRSICALAAVGITGGTVLFVNQIASAGEVIRTDRTVVNRICAETRYRSKRVTARRYTNSDPYTAFVAELKFSDDRVHSIDVPIACARRLKTGDTINIPIVRGFFGIPFFRHPEILKNNINK